jgi:hypothetical protein
MSAGRVWDEYGEQFGRSSGQHRVNTLGGVTDCFSRDGNLPNDASSGLVRADFENGSTGGQPSRSTYSMVFGLSMGNVRVMDRGYLEDVGRYTTKPRGARRMVR